MPLNAIEVSQQHLAMTLVHVIQRPTACMYLPAALIFSCPFTAVRQFNIMKREIRMKNTARQNRRNRSLRVMQLCALHTLEFKQK